MKRISIFSLVALLILSSLFIYGCGDSGSTPGSENTNPSVSTQNKQTASYTDISIEDLKSMMKNNKDLIVVDVREKFEWDNYGHLPGSILIPISEFQARLSELPKDKQIAIICASGSRSPTAAEYMIQMGYSNIFNLREGLVAWPDSLVK